MTNNQNQPREFDAVLGGETPPPTGGAVLGGVKGVKQRLASNVAEARVAALSEALNYGDAGLDLVINALQDVDRQVQRSAYLLLRDKAEAKVKQAIKEYKTWNFSERLHWEHLYRHTDGCLSQFANRKVEEFDPEKGLTETTGVAYALRCVLHGESGEELKQQFEMLIQHPKAKEVEALVFGLWTDWLTEDESSRIVVDLLINAKEKLENLQALFIGDIQEHEWMISYIEQCDLSPILAAYPKLEVLQVRGGKGLEFTKLQHNNLKALIIEAGVLYRRTIAQLCALNLPELEHLEFWLGSGLYGADSRIDDLAPILSGNLFPNLTYLGLRNSEISDNIAKALVNSSIINYLQVLDLSMGTLGDEGAEALLNCSAVKQLDILNVYENYLSDKVIIKLSQLPIQVLADQQKYYKDHHYLNKHRYCSISE
ncbi:hypothetical protein RIVM261_089330 [Rivularia sp. IAM M-261]|nr:hypothetical protein RIVM261_089330 [Rivularia sp. IAM M-261]